METVRSMRKGGFSAACAVLLAWGGAPEPLYSRGLPEERLSVRRLPASLGSKVAAAARPVGRFARSQLGRPAALLPSRRALPGHLRDREHWDYPAALRWVPRSWTSFQWGRPRMILGNQGDRRYNSPKPIGRPGTFQISRYPALPAPFRWMPLYFAATTPGGWHLRLGARWDDEDHYISLPSIAIKKIPVQID